MPAQRICKKSADFPGLVYIVKSNQIFHYTRCSTPKGVTSLRAHLRVIAPGQHSSFQRNVAAVARRWQQCVRFDRPEI